MRKIDHNWVLVTGVPRSGTTFVGRMLSLPLSVNLIYEPTNPTTGIPGFEQRYLYLRPDGSISRPDYERRLASIFDYTLSLKTRIKSGEAFYRKVGKRVLGGGNVFTLRLAKVNPLARATVIKDPVACLLTEYLHTVYAVKPVVMVRHPFSLIASVKRLGWKWSPAPLVAQPELVEDFYRDEAELLRETGADPIRGAAVVWRLLNKVILAQAARHPEWRVVKHEDLGERPVEIFRDLYEALGLPWSGRVERRIVDMTSARNPSGPRANRVHDLRRDSSRIFRTLSGSLSLEERRAIWDITAPVARRLYPEESFGAV